MYHEALAPTPDFPDQIGTIPFDGGQTWFRINEGTPGTPPLVVLHGGPGSAHNYCLPMANLARAGRTVILYDQVGCGNSTHRPDAPADYWSIDTFVRELESLIDTLGIRDGYHVLGQSWGGVLATEFAVRQPPGLRGLILANTMTSMTKWHTEASRLIQELPEPFRTDLSQGELTGVRGTEAYRAATREYYARHVCRVSPLPDYVGYSFAQIDADPTVYHTMNGLTEFSITGSLRNWSAEGRMSEVAVQTLVLAGAFDEATPPVWSQFLVEIPHVTSHVFARSSHMPHVEEHAAFIDVVSAFLNDCDG